MIRYVDIHSHLNFPEYDADREEIIARMKEMGIATITVGTTFESSQSAVALAEQHENIFACIGVHPHEIEEGVSKMPFGVEKFESLVKSPKVVAIGECGLDYGRDGKMDGADDFEEKKQLQKELFSAQIDFAVKHDKPIMIHARNAAEDILALLKEKKQLYKEKLRGNAHFFSGDTKEAQAYFDLDFTVSFTGVITFARDYDETVLFTPLDKLMSETDAPYVSPKPHRGTRNDPTRVPYVVAKIAEIKGVEEGEVAQEILKTAVAKWNLVW